MKTINLEAYQNILWENVRAAVHDLKLKRHWVLLQDNDARHTSKAKSTLPSGSVLVVSIKKDDKNN